jgi:hypothetical protein
MPLLWTVMFVVPWFQVALRLWSPMMPNRMVPLPSFRIMP